MIKVRMLDDIRKFEPKFIGPFTKRQSISVGLALGIFIPLFLIIPSTIFMKIAISIFFAGPVAMTGWLKFDNLYTEEYLIRVLYRVFLTDKYRIYKTELEFKKFSDERKKIKETQKNNEFLKSLSKKEYNRIVKQGGVDYGNYERFE